MLFVCPWPPLGRGSGGQIASELLLRLYAEHYDVDLIVGVSPGLEFRNAELPDCVSVRDTIQLRLQFGMHRFYTAGVAATAWIAGDSFRARKMATSEMRRAVHRALAARRYQLVHMDMVLLAAVLPEGLQVPVVVTAHNVEVEVLERLARSGGTLLHRLAARVETSRVARVESDALRRADAVITMCDRDADVLARRYRVDRRSLMPVYPWFDSDVLPARPIPQGRQVTLLGSLASPGRAEGTIWFVEDVWPLVKQRVPDATLAIAGSAPPPRIRSYHGRNGIQILGFVENLDRLLVHTRVVAVPLHAGGGIRMKTLEMLSRGIPVISTTMGATGLRDATMPLLALADGPADFAAHCAALLLDDDQWVARSAAGIEHVAMRYSRGEARDAFDRVIATATLAVSARGNANDSRGAPGTAP